MKRREVLNSLAVAGAASAVGMQPEALSHRPAGRDRSQQEQSLHPLLKHLTAHACTGRSGDSAAQSCS
jgi:hypothetical protein